MVLDFAEKFHSIRIDSAMTEYMCNSYYICITSLSANSSALNSELSEVVPLFVGLF